ncbi:hypothetical protein C8A00DRAFT_17312, partial [Chaetomidium leptoderma]
AHPNTAADVIKACEKLTKPSKNVTELLKAAPVRELSFNLTKTGQPRTLTLNRTYNFEAALMQLTGVEAEDQYDTCKKHTGPFATCVVSDICSGGSCASCHYNSEGKRCSFRKEGSISKHRQ